MAGCADGRGSERMGAAWGCCRWARKSLWTVFSVQLSEIMGVVKIW